MVKLTPPQQREFMEAHGEIFSPASGAWGRQGYTTVVFDAADEEALGEAMTLAWRNAVSRRAPRKTARRPAKRSKKR